MNAYLLGFTLDELGDIPFEIIAVMSVADIPLPQDAILVVHERVQEMITERIPYAIRILPKGQIGFKMNPNFAAHVREGDWDELLELLACTKRFFHGDLVWSHPKITREWIEAFAETVHLLPARALSLNITDQFHLDICRYCREEFDLQVSERNRTSNRLRN